MVFGAEHTFLCLFILPVALRLYLSGEMTTSCSPEGVILCRSCSVWPRSTTFQGHESQALHGHLSCGLCAYTSCDGAKAGVQRGPGLSHLSVLVVAQSLCGASVAWGPCLAQLCQLATWRGRAQNAWLPGSVRALPD